MMADNADRSRTKFTFGYWLNGWRKNPTDLSPDVLGIETGAYGLALDVADLRHPRFGWLDDNVTYTEALAKGIDRLANLGAAELAISLETGGAVYHAVRCRAADSRDVSRLKDVRLWESGRWAQHYEFFDLVFEDAAGRPLGCRGSMHLVAWPDRFAITAELTPDQVWRDGPAPGIHGFGRFIEHEAVDVPHRPGLDPAVFSAELWFQAPLFCSPNPQGWLLSKNGNEHEDGSYGFFFDGRKIWGIINVGGGPQHEYAVPQKGWVIPANTWIHVALTYDGQELRLYVDGALQGAKAISRPRTPGTGPLRIGQQVNGLTPPVRGVYDQVRLWNRALAASEIAAHTAAPGEWPASRAGLVFEETFSADDERVPVGEPWQDAVLTIRFADGARRWQERVPVPGAWSPAETQRASLVIDPVGSARGVVPLRVSTAAGHPVPVRFESEYGCAVARVKNLERPQPAAPGDIRAYDEFLVEVDGGGDGGGRAIPFLLDLSPPASITGLCPILCDEDGVPTGLPVQLSKNWHEHSLGAYLRAYLWLPAVAATRRYRLRIVYGFYGTLPSASHAQLSLVGWGCNGRWDQLAIGCWGETFCLDMDLTPTEQTITDVRAMLVRNGKDGPKWQWSEAGWGGDWLNVSDCEGNRHRFRRLKTAYLAHGPCLSDVRYVGEYGTNGACRLDATVRTLRTDDYVRTFQALRYEVRAALSIEGGWFMKMGNTHNLSTPRVAYGNRGGLVAEIEGPQIHGLGEEVVEPGTGALRLKHCMKHLDPVVDRVTIQGEGPWWVAFPGADPVRPTGRRDTFGHASRALVIRGFRASLGGQPVTAPTILMTVHAMNADGTPNIDLLLVPPRGVTRLGPGDWIELDTEWLTVPRNADDYYGPNEALRQHLAESPCSWQTIYREAAGNDLQLEVRGGTVKHRYPPIIEAQGNPVEIAIEGGVGAVPVRFEGLESLDHALFELVNGREIPLDQAVHGNDFWQTDYDPASDTYRLTFNLPLDGKQTSRWVLKHPR